MTRVIVHVERLVLKGFDQGHSERISADLQRELGRLLADPAASGRLASLPHTPGIRLGTQSATRGAKLESPGVATARAIAKGLAK